jgi:hypothetical protein
MVLPSRSVRVPLPSALYLTLITGDRLVTSTPLAMTLTSKGREVMRWVRSMGCPCA